jgi:hypothetical protein
MSAGEIDAGLQSSLYESVGRADGGATFLHALARSYGGGKATLAAIQGVGARTSVHLATGQSEPEQVDQYNRYYNLNRDRLKPGGHAARL